MPYVDRPLPEGLELPKLREKGQVNEKSLANLTWRDGRIPGSINRISKDLKNGVLNGAIAYGCDGQGTGGLDGYLYMCAGKYPKAYLHLLGKLMPMQVQGDGIVRPGVSISVISVDSGNYLSAADCERMSAPGQMIEQAAVEQAKPEHQIAPEEALPTPSLTALETKLLALGHDQLLELARTLNVGK
jgi:hypothetical protein